MAAKKDTIEIYESRRNPGQYGWWYKTKNGKKIATCGELYVSHKHAMKMVEYLFGAASHERVTNVVVPKKAKR